MTSILKPLPGVEVPSERRQTFAINTERAQEIIREVWPVVTKEPGDVAPIVMVAVLAIARGESGYGLGWKNDALLGNWGSVQCPNIGSDCSPAAQRGQVCALASDTTDGTEKTRRPQCFRVYESHKDGASDFVRHLVVNRRAVRPTLNGGDALTIAHVMREQSYYAKKLPERHYATMIYTNAREVSRRLKLGELVFLRPCGDCGAGSGEACAKPRVVRGVPVRCPGRWYDGPVNTGPSLAPAEPAAGPGLPAYAVREYLGAGSLVEAPSSFDGGGGVLLAGAAVAYLLGGFPL